MIDDYKELLITVSDGLTQIGFTLEDDTEFFAVFRFDEHWKLIFEGERYVRPAFDLALILEDDKSHKIGVFSLRLLMQVLGDSRPPSLSNQLDFLAKHHTDLMVIPPVYEDQYRKLNSE